MVQNNYIYGVVNYFKIMLSNHKINQICRFNKQIKMDNLEIKIIIVKICNKKKIQVMIIKNKYKKSINNRRKLMFRRWKNFDLNI